MLSLLSGIIDLYFYFYFILFIFFGGEEEGGNKLAHGDEGCRSLDFIADCKLR